MRRTNGRERGEPAGQSKCLYTISPSAPLIRRHVNQSRSSALINTGFRWSRLPTYLSNDTNAIWRDTCASVKRLVLPFLLSPPFVLLRRSAIPPPPPPNPIARSACFPIILSPCIEELDTAEARVQRGWKAKNGEPDERENIPRRGGELLRRDRRSGTNTNV